MTDADSTAGPAGGQPPGHGPTAVHAALAEAVRLGVIGTGALGDHIAHAEAMGRAVVAALHGVPDRLLDLGSGGGLPGIVLAARWPECEVVLLDASTRRCALLDRALERLSRHRGRVVVGRAETLAHGAALREQYAAVTARAFGPPAVTAECATGFVRSGGVIVVAEPTDAAPDRWPVAALEHLQLAVVARSESPALVVLRKQGTLADDLPRRTGRPAKRPLW